MSAKKGFTLVEILVALFLSSLVISGLIGLWVSATNFATSSKQELLWRNQLSVGARKMQKDIIEAVSVSVSTGLNNTPNPIPCEKGGKAFLTIYKNYYPDLRACLVPVDPNSVVKKASKVFYCFIPDDSGKSGSIFREEGIFRCDQITEYNCVCDGKGDLIVKNVVPGTISIIALTGMANSFQIQLQGYLEVGKNNRPVTINYDKTFNSIGGQ
ncbi:MAG: prepilin-type N-terminal cleavage/methylation domain-containing protein [Elusimicrobia bacterium]|nr:prepilin-type N-terminal cleavage/methylation domain-containing protein [Elusimicrobiota bacterium]